MFRSRYDRIVRAFPVISTVALLSVAVVVASPGIAMPGEAQTTYSGRAFGILVAPPSLPPTIVCDTGELPSSGGSLSDIVTNGSVSLAGQILAAARLNCVTAGAGVSANSTTSVDGLDCTLNYLLLTTTLAADSVRAEAVAACGSTFGATSISNLTIGGLAVSVTGVANQVVEIPGIATLVINEQVMAAGMITVNALHLTLVDGTECIIGSAHSDILECPPLATEQSTWGRVKALYR